MNDRLSISVLALPPRPRDEVFGALAGTAPPVLVCASTRQAQALHASYAQWRSQRGDAVWATPQILGFETWIKTLHAQLAATLALRGRRLPPLLAPAETRLLWRLSVESSRDTPLLRSAEAAQLAAEAWALAHEYRLRLPFDAQGQVDIERFNSWAHRYREQLKRLGVIDAVGLEAMILSALREQELAAPAACIFAGFSADTPRLGAWLETLVARSCQLLRLNPESAPVSPQLRLAADDEQELRAAARWARDGALRMPAARIGIVVPDLGARRAAVQRIFDEQLCPSADAIDAASPTRPYNLTLGVPLAQCAVVQTALQLLQLLAGALDAASASSLLGSPYWGADAQTRLARAALDARLHREGQLEVDLDALQRHVRALRSTAVADSLRRYASHASTRRLRPDEWNEHFSRALEAAQWPGPRALASEEFQALARWHEVLVEFARLERVLGRIPASAAVAQLRELAESTLFQAQSAETAIEVMGVLEAQGLAFDALWVTALDDERWPAASRPHPFIPHALQRQHGLPHASAAKELDYAQAQLDGWRRATRELVLSHALGSEERNRAPSPLLAPWLQTSLAVQVDAWPAHWQAQLDAARCQTLDDARGPPPLAETVLGGGTAVLGDQARCPFRAYALHRLGARPWPSAGYGLQPRDRGELTHRVLERLWRQWREQAALLALTDEDCAAQIASAVDGELERVQQLAPQRLGAQLRALEHERLCALVAAWLALERQRPPFRVLALEAQESEAGAATTRFEDLQLRLRPDRIDIDAAGRRIVLDYKTGARKTPPWADGRPEDPQLLLYALTEAEVGAIAFARLVAGQVELQGVGSDERFGDGIKAYHAERATRDAASWSALHGRWRGELATLVAEVRGGWAAVQPKQPRVSCQDCGLHALCRIRDQVSLDEGEEVAT